NDILQLFIQKCTLTKGSWAGSILHIQTEIVIFHPETELAGEHDAVGLVEVALNQGNYSQSMYFWFNWHFFQHDIDNG
ncbi:MAG: hypothetical protein ACK53Y_07020, partial [bacterium]